MTLIKSFAYMIKKTYRVFSRKQKKNLWLLMLFIELSAIMELVCVPVVLPLVNLVTYDSSEKQNKILGIISFIFKISSIEQLAVFSIILIMVVYFIKNSIVLLMNRKQYIFIRDGKRELILRLMNTYVYQPYLFHKKHNVAEIQRDIDSDANNFYSLVLTEVQLITELMVCSLIGIYLFFSNPLSTLFIGIVLSVFLGVFLKIYRKRLKKCGQQGRESYSLATKWFLQIFGAVKEIKTNSREEVFIDKYNNAIGWYLDIQCIQSFLTNIPKPILESVGVFAVLMVAVIQIKTGGSVADTLSSLAVFLVAAFRIMPSFNRISGYVTTISYYIASLDAVDLHLQLKSRKNEKENLDLLSFEKAILIRNLHFEYEDKNVILDNANLNIEKYHSVAFIGPSGAGKSTLADIILALIEPQKGGVYVDGKNVSVNIDAWHDKIGYIPQEVYLLDDTIKSNIVFGVPEHKVDQELLNKVVKDAQLESFISSLENGLETIIGEHGARLSGGQKQRIGIARALYKNPELLILDEATSALDNGTEAAVMDAIDRLHGKMTMIIIAHRLTTIQKCDEIYEIRDGKVRLVEGEERENLLHNKNMAK